MIESALMILPKHNGKKFKNFSLIFRDIYVEIKQPYLFKT